MDQYIHLKYTESISNTLFYEYIILLVWLIIVDCLIQFKNDEVLL